MKKTIRILSALAIILSLSTLVGCADFPDEYAFDATIEISQENIKLAEDKYSYEEELVFDFNINNNTFENISEAYVNIDGKEIDVRNQINPKTGGKVTIKNTSSNYGSRDISASLKVAGHMVTNKKNIYTNPDNLVVLETSEASNITVFSATLSALASSYKIGNSSNIYMLVHDKPIDFKIGDQTPENKDGYWGTPHVLQCNNSDGDKYKAEITGLEPDAVYYYQVVRLAYNSSTKMYNVTYSASPKQFTSATSTAKVNVESSPGMFEATIRASVEPGNTDDVKIAASKKLLRLYTGVNPDDLTWSGDFAGNSFVIHSLNPDTKYYYKVEYCFIQSPGNYSRVIESSGVKSFTTKATTASIISNISNINDFGATISGSFNEGNIPSFITQSRYNCSISLYYGKSPDNLKYRTYIESGSTKERFTFKPTLEPNTTYYYKIVCSVTQYYGEYVNEQYYSNSAVTTDVKSFTTSCNSILDIQTFPNWTSTLQSSTDKCTKTYSINAKVGSVLTFDYTDDFNVGSYYFIVELSGSANVTLNYGGYSSSDYCNYGKCFYRFTKAGNYTLKLTFRGHYSNVAVKNIEVSNIKVYDVSQ